MQSEEQFACRSFSELSKLKKFIIVFTKDSSFYSNSVHVLNQYKQDVHNKSKF